MLPRDPPVETVEGSHKPPPVGIGQVLHWEKESAQSSA